ncbi:MAG: acetylxylan esterase [Clostridiales bacterium]|nr:acetylxylan esterase [Clostridiales bacterium]
MPLIDLPLVKLNTYQGINPKPADFDQYWDRGLQELDKTGLDYEMEPSAYQVPFARCFDLTFTGVGGARVYSKLLMPLQSAGKMPALLQFHGYSGNGGDWTPKLSYVAAGFAVFAMDVRGQGGRSQDVGGTVGNTLYGQIIRGLDEEDPDRLLFRQIYLDCAKLARIAMAMDEIDETRVAATGGSQGGGLSLACAALTPTLNRIAPQMPFLCDYQPVWEMDLAKGAYQELKDYFRKFDPRHEREEDIFLKLGYIDNQHLAGRIRSKVLMLTGLMDEICPPSTQFAAYNRIESSKEMIIYPDFAHEFYPDSDDLIMQFMLEMLQ